MIIDSVGVVETGIGLGLGLGDTNVAQHPAKYRCFNSKVQIKSKKMSKLAFHVHIHIHPGFLYLVLDYIEI
jgi:hypothetical protein